MFKWTWRVFLVGLVAWLGVALHAQGASRPYAVSTLTTTDTSADSLHVGCAVGSSSCTGGIKAGPMTLGGLLTANSANFSGAVSITATTQTRIVEPNVTNIYELGDPSLRWLAVYSDSGDFIDTVKITAPSSATNIRLLGRVADDSAVINFITNNNVTTEGFIQAGPATGMLLGTSVATPFEIYTNNTVRWGINGAGDWLVAGSSGPAVHIVDSVGTPSYGSGFGGSATVVGTDYAFKVSPASGATAGTITFGHVWTNAPICVGSAVIVGSGEAPALSTSTSAVVIDTSLMYPPANSPVYVLCRGY